MVNPSGLVWPVSAPYGAIEKRWTFKGMLEFQQAPRAAR